MSKSEEIFKTIKEIKQTGIPKRVIDLIKNATIGQFIGNYDSPSGLINSFQHYDLYGANFTDYLMTMNNTTVDEVNKGLDFLDENNYTIAIMRPKSSPVQKSDLDLRWRDFSTKFA